MARSSLAPMLSQSNSPRWRYRAMGPLTASSASVGARRCLRAQDTQRCRCDHRWYIDNVALAGAVRESLAVGPPRRVPMSFANCLRSRVRALEQVSMLETPHRARALARAQPDGRAAVDAARRRTAIGVKRDRWRDAPGVISVPFGQSLCGRADRARVARIQRRRIGSSVRSSSSLCTTRRNRAADDVHQRGDVRIRRRVVEDAGA